MRFIKMFGLAAMAAVAAMAIVGAATASAGIHESIGFCLQNEGLLCQAANIIDPPAGGKLLILAEALNPTLHNNAFFETSEKCEKSSVDVSATETMNNPINGSVNALSFTNCEPCKKVEAKGLPWANGELKMASTTGPWELHSNEGGALLSECTLGAECEYGVPATGVTLKGENEVAGANVKAVNVSLKYKAGSGEFLCGSTGTWNAQYKATAIHLINSSGGDIGLHSPWWFTLLGTTNAKG